jgi:hypothetical protein
MALEPITRQEQIIAGKDLEPITRMERFLKDYGVSNYFGETTVKGDTLTWDGNTEGKTTLEVSEISCVFVKISDAIPALSDCKNGMVVQTADGAETTYSAEEIDGLYNEIGVVGNQLGTYVIPSDGFVLMEAFTLPESGVWVVYVENAPYVTSITIPGYNGFETTTIQPIDAKYLPPLVSPSGKKFKLSVDDSGVLSATEV